MTALAKTDPGIACLQDAKRLLAKLTTVQEVKQVRDQAETIRVYCQRAKLGLENQNAAAEAKLMAERRCGELLSKTEKKANRHSRCNTLLQLGIDRMQASRWQRLATVPEDQLDSFVSLSKADNKELTTAGALRLVSKKPAKPSAWTLDEAQEYLREKLAAILEKWPQDSLSVLVGQLRDIADEIEESPETLRGSC